MEVLSKFVFNFDKYIFYDPTTILGHTFTLSFALVRADFITILGAAGTFAVAHGESLVCSIGET